MTEDAGQDVLILGAGQQGTRGLEKFIDSIWNADETLSEQYPVNTVTVVDHDRDRIEELKENYNDDIVQYITDTAEDYINRQGLADLTIDTVSTASREDVTQAMAACDDPGTILFEKPASVGTTPDYIQELENSGAVMSEHQVEMFSREKQSVIKDIREHGYSIDAIQTWRLSEPGKMPGSDRHLLRDNSGSAKDKGAHDWGKITATLEASGQLDDTSQLSVSDDSTYLPVTVNGTAYTSDGKPVNPDSDRRLNDGYADIQATIGDVSLRTVTSLVGWDDTVERDMEQLNERFKEGIEEALDGADLIYGDPGNREVRVEHVEATDPSDGSSVEYLVSTGADKFTLKNEEGQFSLLAAGPNDWHAAYLEEGLEIATGDRGEPTVDIDAALRAGAANDRAASEAYQDDQILEMCVPEPVADRDLYTITVTGANRTLYTQTIEREELMSYRGVLDLS